MPIDINDPRVTLQRKYRNLAQINANGGYYVTDCHPWAIKEGCPREDCPMRWVAATPEPKASDYFLECSPVGDLADMFLLLEQVSP